jgi:DNA-binding MarR family transcriptional regulator
MLDQILLIRNIQLNQPGQAMTANDVTDCAFYLISRASLVGTSALKKELAAAGAEGIKPAYLGVLMILWAQDGLKAVELGRRVGLEPSSMTGLLDRMERDGLLTRQADPGDRRAQRIVLTARGRRARKPVSAVLDRALDTMFEGVAERDVEQLKQTLRQVLANAHRLGHR